MAKYRLFKNPSPDPEQANGNLHARIVSRYKFTTEELMDQIREMSSFTRGDVKGILSLLRLLLEDILTKGDSLELEGIGTFSISLKNPPMPRVRDITPRRVKVGKIVFRPNKELKQSINRNFHIIREKKVLPSCMNPVKRRQNILTWLEEEVLITKDQCRDLNNCSSYMALKDLNNLIEEGVLERFETKNKGLYRLKKQK
jgi:predicted histone-like DNA-binding protein